MAWAQFGLQIERVRAVDRSGMEDLASEGVAVDGTAEQKATEPLVIEAPILEPSAAADTTVE